MEHVTEIVEALEHMMADEIPKSVNCLLKDILTEIQSTKELSLTVNKAMGELEDLSNDVNIPVFVRTQLWGVISMLAALEAQIVKA